MAEFQEVMGQIARLCAVTPCSENCPLESECMNLAQAAESIHAKRIEHIVMKWAAIHPEPEYPSWYEYLTGMYPAAWNMIKDKPIPDDIAQKLGIEPK